MSAFKSYDDIATHSNGGSTVCAMVINSKIWYILQEEQKSKWMVYDVNTNSHSFVTDLPNMASIDLSNSRYVVCDDKIYLFSHRYKHGPIIFNTKTTNHSIQISNQWHPLFIPKISMEINGNVYHFEYNKYQIYNISKQQFGALQDLNDRIWNMIYDDKQKQWIVISDACDMSYGDAQIGFSLFKDINQYDPICQIDLEFIHSIYGYSYDVYAEPTMNVLYDNYIITISRERNGIFVLDLITGNLKILNVLKKNPGRCHAVIVDHPNGITQSIIKQYIESLKDNESVFIPNDIQILIGAFCGDYYNKTIHLFENRISSGKKAHFSISLGFIINTFMKQQTNFEEKEDEEKEEEEEDKGVNMDEYDAVFDEMERINHEKEVLIKEMMEEYKRLFEEKLMLQNRLKMYEH